MFFDQKLCSVSKIVYPKCMKYFSKRWLHLSTLVLSGLFVLISYENCGMVTTPSFESGSGNTLSASHKLADATNCASCHGAGKTVNSYPSNHIAITQDCTECHTAYPAGWKEDYGTTFAHPATIVGTGETGTCNLCHAAGAVYDRYPTNHVSIGESKCSQCHTSTTSW
jgi:hypothetical protein